MATEEVKEVKEEVTSNANTTKEETVVKNPIDINISEDTQQSIVTTIKNFFSKYASGNSTYKLLFYSVLILVVFVSAVLSYFGVITTDSFKDILDTFLNIFSEPESAVESVSYFMDKTNLQYFIG